MKRIFLIFLVFIGFPSAYGHRVVVTGGAGLIGSHLCQSLLDDGCDVICLDNLTSGDQRHVDRLQENPRFTFIKHDICNPVQIAEHIDAVYNLACPASPVFYQADPIQTLKTSFIGTFNMLELAKAHNAKFLHTSTSEIYGDPLLHPQEESYWGNVNPHGIRSCYDEGKRVAESLIFSYRNHYQLDTKIVRIFNTYGPNMRLDDGRVISNFITQALNGKPITVYGEGVQTRSICYVKDLVVGLRLMMEGPFTCSGPINLGNPQEMTILEIAQKIITMTGSHSEIIHLPLPQDDPHRRRPDISKAEKELGWKPTTTLDEGLMQTINYFKNLIDD